MRVQARRQLLQQARECRSGKFKQGTGRQGAAMRVRAAGAALKAQAARQETCRMQTWTYGPCSTEDPGGATQTGSTWWTTRNAPQSAT